MAINKNLQKESYWRDLVHRQAHSQLSIRQFCSQQEIPEASFYAWRRELKLRDREQRLSPTSPAFQDAAEQKCESSATSGSAGNGHAFIPVQVIEEPNALELIHPLGYQLRIFGEVNATVLNQVLDVLDQRAKS